MKILDWATYWCDNEPLEDDKFKNDYCARAENYEGFYHELHVLQPMRRCCYPFALHQWARNCIHRPYRPREHQLVRMFLAAVYLNFTTISRGTCKHHYSTRSCSHGERHFVLAFRVSADTMGFSLREIFFLLRPRECRSLNFRASKAAVQKWMWDGLHGYFLQMTGSNFFEYSKWKVHRIYLDICSADIFPLRYFWHRATAACDFISSRDLHF